LIATVTVKPASFAQRAVGRAIDLGILTILLVGSLLGFVDEDAAGHSRIDAPWWFLLLLAVAIVTYEVVPVHLRGQTPGKVLARTRVVDIETGQPPSWRNSFVRWIIVFALFAVSNAVSPAVSIVLVAILFCTAFADPNGRSLLDKAAHTRVVRAEG